MCLTRDWRTESEFRVRVGLKGKYGEGGEYKMMVWGVYFKASEDVAALVLNSKEELISYVGVFGRVARSEN